MSGVNIVPNLEEQLQAVELQEKIYKYQPVDDLGRPLGGEQVIKYKTESELVDKLRDQNIEVIKKMRELNKKIRLGLVEEVPENSQRFDAEFVDFSPKSLTPEERINISRDLLDPDKVEAAQQRLIEAELGATPEKIRKILNQSQQDISAMRAKAEADAFMEATPDFYKCKENSKIIVDYLIKQNLAPVFDNFKYAYEQLKAAGLLLYAPIVREVISANTQPNTEQDGRITDQVSTQLPRPTTQVSSGLNRNVATSNVIVDSTKRAYTLDEINKMPSEMYKQKFLHEPGFKDLVETLEEQRAKKLSQR